jgi:hypothetical protein
MAPPSDSTARLLARDGGDLRLSLCDGQTDRVTAGRYHHFRTHHWRGPFVLTQLEVYDCGGPLNQRCLLMALTKVR